MLVGQLTTGLPNNCIKGLLNIAEERGEVGGSCTS